MRLYDCFPPNRLEAGYGRLGELADGRIGVFNFGEVGFGRTTALEKADRRVWVDGGQRIKNNWSCLTRTRGQLGANPQQNMEGFGHLRLTWWDRATRYQQIRRYVDRVGLVDWVAIDNQPEGWADADNDHLIQTDGSIGLSDPAVLEKLVARLDTNK